MDQHAFSLIESLPTPMPVVISRACVGVSTLSLLLGTYVLQARDRVARANRELQRLKIAHR